MSKAIPITNSIHYKQNVNSLVSSTHIHLVAAPTSNNN